MNSVRQMLSSFKLHTRPRAHLLHFVVGVPRSGTTLCRMMLGTHPRIYAPAETPWVFGAYGVDATLAELVRTLCKSKYGPVESIIGVSNFDVYLAAEQFISTLFESRMRADAKGILVLKTPDDIAFIGEILDIFPRSVIIHVRRDVRDVALSTIRTGWPHLNFFGPNNFENAVRRWVAWEWKIEAAKAKDAGRIVSVKYEDLVLRPEVALEPVLNHLRVKFDRDMLSYWKHAHDVPDWDLGSRHAADYRNIEPLRAFAYRTIAPSSEQRRVISDHELDIVALGYKPGWYD